MAMGEDKVMLTVEEAAARLSLGRTTLYELLSRGEIKAVHIGRAVRVLARDVAAFAERLADSTRP